MAPQSVFDGMKEGLKDVGGQLIGNIAQSAEDKVGEKLDSMTDALNKNAERVMEEIIELSVYLKIAIILFSILIIIMMAKSCCEGITLIVRMGRPSPSRESSKHEREPKMSAPAQTNDKIEVELFSLRRAVERDAEMITTELVSLVFFCKVAVVICCVLLGISVLKKLFLGSDSICGMMHRSKYAPANPREIEEQRKLAL